MSRSLVKQKGMVLLTALVMLLIVTIIGVWSVRSSMFEELMSRNSQNSLLAFQAAESALIEAELFLSGVVVLSDFSESGANGLWTASATGDPERWQSINWDGEGYAEVETSISGLAEQPKYMIEILTEIEPETNSLNLDNIGQEASSSALQVFKITARGVGGATGNVVVLQSTYGLEI